MVDAVLLILREVLEAALIISLLLVLSRKVAMSFRWFLPALILGLSISWLLADYAYEIAYAFDNTGQELINSILYFLVIITFVIISNIIIPMLFNTPENNHHLSPMHSFHKTLFFWSCVFAVGLSLAREVAEIWIYLGGFHNQSVLLHAALTGGAIGLGIGISLGIITYYLLLFITLRKFLWIFLVIMLLLCGGLAMQIAKQLMQIGVLDSSIPLWDSSGIIDEHSWPGELLYALTGYDSNPSRIQIIFYCLAITPIISIFLWNFFRRKNKYV